MRERLKELGIYILAILLTTGLALSVLFGFVAIRDSVVAAPPATSDNCTTIGTVGSVIVARCVDPDSDEAVWANSAGFIDVVEE